MTTEMLNELSLFSGYGGFSLGLRLAGLNIRTVGYVEIDPYCQELLRGRIRDRFLDWAPIITNIRAADFRPMAGMVDIITAGFPCQPHSVAGLQRGANDERNLWPDTLRVIREVGPRYVLLENVPGLLSASSDGGRPAYGGTVVGELASLGYSVHWQTIGADDVGAPHRRKRWWCIAVADSEGEFSQRVKPEGSGCREPQEAVGNRSGDGQLADSDSNRARERHNSHAERGYPGEIPEGRDSQGTQDEGTHTDISSATGGEDMGDIPIWPPSPSDAHAWERVIRERPDLAPALSKEAESQFRGMVNGSSDRLDRPPANDRVNRLKVLGNGIVPQALAEFLRRVT
jgi:DNA (cytosine-5)-methyltransferase 1